MPVAPPRTGLRLGDGRELTAQLRKNAVEAADFLLDGCQDTEPGVGRGFFVETLRSEFHPIRSTLEAYTASAVIADADEASACGIGMSDQAPWNLTVRVSATHSVATYYIDRWD